MPLLDTDSTIADVRAILKEIGLEADSEEISAMWQVRSRADLRCALIEQHEEQWARSYLTEALSDARQLIANTLPAAAGPDCPTGSTLLHTGGRGTPSRVTKMPHRSSVPSIFDRHSLLSPDATACLHNSAAAGGPCAKPKAQLTVCGATTAVRFGPSRGADEAPAVLLEAARPCSGRRYDWTRQIDFLLEQEHLPTALMVVTGHLPKTSFSSGKPRDRTIVEFVDQRSYVQLSIRRGTDARSLSIGPMQALALAALIAAQIEAGLAFVPRGDIGLLICRTVGRMTAAALPAATKHVRHRRANA